MIWGHPHFRKPPYSTIIVLGAGATGVPRGSASAVNLGGVQMQLLWLGIRLQSGLEMRKFVLKCTQKYPKIIKNNNSKMNDF